MRSLLVKADVVMGRVYGDYLRFFKYMGVGMIGTVADWGVFYVLVGIFDVVPMYGVALSYFVGMVINFFLNKRYTFNNTYKKVHFQFLSFALVAVIGLMLTEVLLAGLLGFVFRNPSDLGLMFSRVVVTFIVFIWNFAANKRTTFKFFR